MCKNLLSCIFCWSLFGHFSKNALKKPVFSRFLKGVSGSSPIFRIELKYWNPYFVRVLVFFFAFSVEKRGRKGANSKNLVTAPTLQASSTTTLQHTVANSYFRKYIKCRNSIQLLRVWMLFLFLCPISGLLHFYDYIINNAGAIYNVSMPYTGLTYFSQNS